MMQTTGIISMKNSILKSSGLTIAFLLLGAAVTAGEIVEKKFASVADMQQAQNLKTGWKIKTFRYNAPVISNWEIVRKLEGNDFGVKLKNGNYAKLMIERINILAFGAKPGDYDSHKAIQAAVDFAVARSRKHYMKLPKTTAAPAVEIFFPAGNYNISQPVVNKEWGSLSFVGEGRSTIYRKKPLNPPRFLFEFDGKGFNLNFRDLHFIASPKGCIDLCNLNRSSSMIEFLRCRFTHNPETYGATGVVIDNQSANVEFKHCLFQNIKHPLHVVNCDFTCLDGCWFGFPYNSVYKNRDALILHDAGFMKVTKCLFAGGPSHGKGGAREVAYFNVGVEKTDGPTHYPLLLIENTRIAFEWGAGAIANYFADNKGPTGTGFRCGVIFRNNQFAPREEKVRTIDNAWAVPMVRLFEMPHILILEDSLATERWALVGAGSTTSLKKLRESAGVKFNYNSDLADQNSASPAYVFRSQGLVGTAGFVAATKDYMEYNRWAEMFQVFNYFFKSKSGNTPADNIAIDTFFNDFSDIRGSLYNVSLGVQSNGATNMATGKLVIQRNGQQISGSFVNQIKNSRNDFFKVVPVFVVEGKEYASIDRKQAAKAVLRLKIVSLTKGLKISCTGAIVKPIGADFPAAPFKGTPTFSYPLNRNK